MDNIYLKTEKLIIQPYQKKYLEEYYKEFTDEITKYQYPDIYEVHVRNIASIRLVEKFEYEKGSCEELTTEAGKKLKLQTYYI